MDLCSSGATPAVLSDSLWRIEWAVFDSVQFDYTIHISDFTMFGMAANLITYLTVDLYQCSAFKGFRLSTKPVELSM